MSLRTIMFLMIAVGGIGFFIYNVMQIILRLKFSQPEMRTHRLPERIKNVLLIAFGQSKLLREPLAGLLHFVIFWGFVLFLFAVLEAFIQGVFPEFTFSFTGIFYYLMTGVQDILGILVIIAVKILFFRRFVLKIPRLQTTGKGRWDALFVLTMIGLIVFSMFGQNIVQLTKPGYSMSWNEFRPISSFIAGFLSFDPETIQLLLGVFWWMHILLILTFLNFLPYSKHFHIVSSVPNVFLSKLQDEKHIIKPLNLEDENADWYGADDIQKLTWKQVLDGYACTECGRCTAACPAATSGKTLSPRQIMVEIRKRSAEISPYWLAGVTDSEAQINTLVHHHITDKELWQCTTCAACVQECPVMIEHVDAIVDMRRHLVLTESVFPAELNVVFKNLEVNASPWAFNPVDRALWAEGLNIKTMAEDQNCEYLFWVGCAGSYDARYQKVSQAFAKIMQAGGIDFRILGAEERCNGDTARRLGNEYLAQQLMQMNVETLNGYGVKKIVTACPHCFHSLKNEYKQFGGNFEVSHHTELISTLIAQGKIIIKQSDGYSKLTYHDSCYLGRYNSIYTEPRKILEKVSDEPLCEMDRNLSRSFCCGAGGGRMFLEDEEGSRINIERTKEALATGASVISTACPFCMTMMNDGIKAAQDAPSVQVKDVAEIIAEMMV